MPAGKPSATRVEVELVDDPRVELRELGLVEPRRRAAEAGEVEARDQRRGIGERLDRIAGPDPREQRDQRLRLDPGLAEMIDAERAEPLRQLAFAAGQQRLVREARAARRPARRTSGAALAVFETWSSPRTTWVMPMSISSITEGSR